MSLSVGIVGLPNAGKSTLFNALTRQSAQTSPYIFTTIEPNRGVVAVNDDRLPLLQKIYGCPAVVPAMVTFIDVAGLIEGAHKGEGLGNRFLANIRETDAVCLVLRAFQQEEVATPLGKLDPVDEMKILETELTLADMEIVEKALEKRERSVKLGEKKYKKEVDVLARVWDRLQKGEPARKAGLSDAEKDLIKSFALITLKETFIVVNISEMDLPGDDFSNRDKLYKFTDERSMWVIPICARLEGELLDLLPEEAEMFAEDMGLKGSGMDRVIKTAYESLDLITFYTGNEKEVRAWSLERGSSAVEAAAKVHTDMAEGFIKAEVVNADKLIEAGSYSSARDLGLITLAGKDYVVNDGDVILIRFSR